MAMAILLACVALSASLSEPVRALNASSGFTPPASSPHEEDWIFPGEFESHQAMWMLWPTYENKAGLPSTEVTADLITAMSGHVHVNLAVQDRADEVTAREYLVARGVPLDHVHFFHIPHLDLWARDMGPQFTRSRAGQLRVNDWNFDNHRPHDPPRPVHEMDAILQLQAAGGGEAEIGLVDQRGRVEQGAAPPGAKPGAGELAQLGIGGGKQRVGGGGVATLGAMNQLCQADRSPMVAIHLPIATHRAGGPGPGRIPAPREPVPL